jgi:hypothetical protein
VEVEVRLGRVARVPAEPEQGELAVAEVEHDVVPGRRGAVLDLDLRPVVADAVHRLDDARVRLRDDRPPHAQ